MRATFRCSAAESRRGDEVAQSAPPPNQSSKLGACEIPGVHSVLKKLWLVPIIRTLLRSDGSSGAAVCVASTKRWPWRSKTSPSQLGRNTDVGT